MSGSNESLLIVAIVRVRFAYFRLRQRTKHVGSFVMIRVMARGFLKTSLVNDIINGKVAKFPMGKTGGRLDGKRLGGMIIPVNTV